MDFFGRGKLFPALHIRGRLVIQFREKLWQKGQKGQICSLKEWKELEAYLRGAVESSM